MATKTAEKEIEKITKSIPLEKLNPEDKVNAASLDAEARKWGEELSKEEKVEIKIKSTAKEDTTPVPVGINGYFFWINKNEKVKVPKSVARLLEEAEYI